MEREVGGKFKRQGHMYVCMHAKSLQSCPTLCDLWTTAHQSPLSMGFSRQEYWSGWLCPPPGDLPNPKMEPKSLMSPALQADSLSTELSGKQIGKIKDRNSMDLTEAEDIKKRWQEYIEELDKKDLNDTNNHNNVITHLEPDILE